MLFCIRAIGHADYPLTGSILLTGLFWLRSTFQGMIILGYHSGQKTVIQYAVCQKEMMGLLLDHPYFKGQYIHAIAYFA